MVEIGNPASLQLQNLTIETWVKRGSTTTATSDPAAVAGNGLLFGYGHNGYALGLTPAGKILLTQVDVNSVASSAAITDTNYHHVAVTTAGGSVIFYLDGVAYPGGTYNPTYQFTTSAAIGGRADHINANNNDSFLGSIDEVSIYNRALASNEIAAIYAAGSAGKCLSALLSIQSSGPTNADISFQSVSNQIYTLQQTTNLVPALWNNYTNLVGNGSLLQVIVPVAGVPQSFFRALIR